MDEIKETESKKIRVMIAGLPGKMAWDIALAIKASKDMELVPYALTGKEIENRSLLINGEEIQLLDSSQAKTLIHYFKVDGFPDVVIDASVSGAIKGNVDFYTTVHLPFVMLTTGGDLDYIREKVAEVQKHADFYNAVVSTNMAEDIVIVQAMFEYAAETFPGAFKRFTVEVEESHQNGKKLTSGTAEVIVASLEKLGTNASVEKIKKNRTPEENSAFGVPVQYHERHGYHTYSLTRDDNNVFLQFVHNINGGKPYVDGTLNAVRYLIQVQRLRLCSGNVFTMIDVLKGF